MNVFVFLLMIFVPIALLVSCAQGIDRFQCADVGKQTGMDHRYSWVSGCYIRTKNGQWIPADRFRSVSED